MKSIQRFIQHPFNIHVCCRTHILLTYYPYICTRHGASKIYDSQKGCVMYDENGWTLKWRKIINDTNKR